jgi:uncharacterized protein (TIGR03083 family)
MSESPGALPDADLLAAFDAAVAAFAQLPTGMGRTPVPSCPEWNLYELQEHMGSIHEWAMIALTTKPKKRPPRKRLPLAKRADRHAFVAGHAAALREAFLAADMDEPIWTFVGPQPARWWLRRQAHETSVHAVDAIETVGTGDFAIPPRLAVDGIAEMLEVFVPNAFSLEAFGGGGETIHLHATDVPGEWLVRFDKDGVVVTGEHAKGDLAARGPALDLLRLLWGRTPGPALELFGDTTIIDRFHQSSRF